MDLKSKGLTRFYFLLRVTRHSNILWQRVNGSGVLADMAVDPGGELVDPGVDPRLVGSAAARPPADDAHQEPATSSRGPTGQRTSRVALGDAGRQARTQ